jgi:hypothetical protein
MAIPVQAFVNRLAAESRVVVLGGLAVIAHGLSRHTQDVDVWTRELALEHLREFAAEGDPFSQAILAGRPVPGG